MKRSMCGIVLLAAATALWSCNGDPTESIREGEKILATPTSLFLDVGTTTFVTVELVDGQGNQLEAEFNPQNVGPGITVERDTAFLQTSTGHIQTSERFVVGAGATPVSSSFEMTSGGQTITIPVRVLPTTFAATFSNATPAQNELVTITAPTGYKFTPEATVTFGTTEAIVISRAADSSSITFVPVPAGGPLTGSATVSGVVVSDVAPTAPITLATVDPFTVPQIAALSGSDDPSTAPALPVPAAGQTIVAFDLPDFAATIDHYYRLDIPEAGDYTITTDWSIGSDVDQIICDDVACTEPNDYTAATGAQPETATYTFAVGTYYLWIEDYAGDAAGATLTITLEH